MAQMEPAGSAVAIITLSALDEAALIQVAQDPREGRRCRMQLLAEIFYTLTRLEADRDQDPRGELRQIEVLSDLVDDRHERAFTG